MPRKVEDAVPNGNYSSKKSEAETENPHRNSSDPENRAGGGRGKKILKRSKTITAVVAIKRNRESYGVEMERLRKG